ncbi:AmpG family muropeptide MFS transporter [Thiococcus pfennigii]|jgi:PAT family beta-lactamase induction signal transducer AmpG|uniref:AmpG family muropeptide MFS transporter n=1 Tax=Thiococcus pfennigii TaxID=1057 RepID=UPI001908FB3E|nr:AmpG family muropeptide MFS transporter [Thiococcus pfennigii]MBK1701374.1 AmpG family muropeptide MFS transporter [Thiococcus pfennigii]MBK1731515.1 AmpG family muropeptide MFS transporter [Thiococcus pfennigii]
MTETLARSPSVWKTVFSGRMAVAAVMGFSCGLPLLLTLSVLQAWMTEEGVDLGTIGLFALVQLPYTLKFLWAPLTDRFTPPFLGRRRGWLLVFQTLLMVAIVTLGLTNPAADPWLVAGCALAVTFFSASQDIVVDAYRREALADDELGLGASLYVNGYRLGMLLAGGGGLILADFVSFQTVYLLLGLTMAIGIVTTLLAPEPPLLEGRPRSLRAAVVEPFVEFFRRDGALWILAFILLYKLGDSMASAMTTPFYLDIGFSKSEIGAVVKLFGFWATIGGGLLGGLLILRIGLYRSLWHFGLLQAVSTAGFALLAVIGPDTWALAGVIAFENLSGGMGTAAFVGFMAALTDRRFTATQYALLSSLMGVPRVLASAPTGYLAEGFGWVGFFVFCTLIAIPGLLILRHFKAWAAPRSPRGDVVSG